MRKCSGCGEEKGPEEYYPGKGRCRRCLVEYARGRREAGLTQARARERYARDEEHRAKVAAHTRAWKARNPEKLRAENVVGTAIRAGVLTREPCEVCGGKAQAHHADYGKPLEVRWFCSLHHARQHGVEGRLRGLGGRTKATGEGGAVAKAASGAKRKGLEAKVEELEGEVARLKRELAKRAEPVGVRVDAVGVQRGGLGKVGFEHSVVKGKAEKGNGSNRGQMLGHGGMCQCIGCRAGRVVDPLEAE